MAIELFPDSPTLGMSPRISFSHDLSQTDTVPVEQYVRSSSSAGADFDFCVFRESFDQVSSSADELFFDGKILPIEIKKRLAPPPLPPRTAAPPPTPPSLTPQNNAKLPLSSESEDQSKNSSKSFWGFKRSSSLNCGSGYARTLCPLPLLSRSNSTGSTLSSKRCSTSSRESFNHRYKSGSMKQATSNSTGNHQRPPLKKNYSNASFGSNNGVRFNPVLNVPSANLFGLGSIFSSGKDRNKRK